MGNSSHSWFTRHAQSNARDRGICWRRYSGRTTFRSDVAEIVDRMLAMGVLQELSGKNAEHAGSCLYHDIMSEFFPDELNS